MRKNVPRDVLQQLLLDNIATSVATYPENYLILKITLLKFCSLARSY